MKYQRTVTVHVDDVLVDEKLVYDDPLRRDARMNELSLERLMGKLGEEDLEFLRDELCRVAVTDSDPEHDDLECYDFADRIQDRLEIQRYGRVVSVGSVSEE